MKTKLANIITILFFVATGLVLIVEIQLDLIWPRLTAGLVKPARSPDKVILSPTNWHVGVPNSSLTLVGPAGPPAAGEVVSFVKRWHIHGIPYEQARQFGPEAVPILLELLARPENVPYATNIVVTLGFIGHPGARQPLLDYLTQTEGDVSLDQFRGLASVPYALAQLAHQGDLAALTFLLQAADQTYWSGQTLPWTYNGQTYEGELYHKSLLALGVSGLPQALARLEEIKEQAGVSSQADRDVLHQALELNRRVQQEGMAPVVSPDPNLMAPAGGQETIGPLAEDTNVNSHLQTFTVARHVNETGLTSEAQVDAILFKATEIMQVADSPADIACCTALQRHGSLGTFAVTDGFVETSSELISLFTLSSHQVKVVPALDYCGGYNTSIIGCAYLNTPKNMVLEYVGNTTIDGILWAHEFGHNQGLLHPDSTGGFPSRIMNAKLFPKQSNEMLQAECNAWHGTVYNPGLVNGACPLHLTANKTLATTSVVTSGAKITYTLHLNNDTFQAVTGITVSDRMPISTTYIAGSAVANLNIGDLSNFPTSTVPFTLNSQSRLVITYALQVGTVKSKDVLTNTATIVVPVYGQPIQASCLAIVDPIKTYLPLILKNN